MQVPLQKRNLLQDLRHHKRYIVNAGMPEVDECSEVLPIQNPFSVFCINLFQHCVFKAKAI